LHLHTANANIVGSIGGDEIQIRSLVHANRNIVVIELKGKPAANANIRLRLDHLDDNAKETLKAWGYDQPEVSQSPTGGSLRFRTPTGFEYAAAWTRTPREEGNTHLITLALLSSDEVDDPLTAARRMAADAAKQADLEKDHLAWWADYWTRSYLTVPELRLESLYYIEMYKLGCNSRPGKLPVTLQGLWTHDGIMPPWSGDYHLDMNVQQSYWPIYTANRLNLGEPMYRTFSKCLPRWQRQCKEFYGFDGVWSGCAIGPKGERVWGYTGVCLWPGNTAWLAHHYWLHFLYSQDTEFLREQALPIMRLSFLTYANLLERGDDGRLHVPLSYSPEWTEGDLPEFRDPNCDLALIRFLAGAILDAEKQLGEPDPLAKRAREVLEQLVEYPRKGNTLYIAADRPMSHSHRHLSHLMAIHPLGLITIDGNDTDRAIIRDSITDLRYQGTGQWAGHTMPSASMIASRAGYGNMAWQMLDMYANLFIRPNTMHINRDVRKFGLSYFDHTQPMTLEGGFATAAALMEMLLQSYNGTIRVFPSMPDRWHGASFVDLRAEGAFLVTATLSAGQTRFVRITSEAGLTCKLKNPFGTQNAELVEIIGGRTDPSSTPQSLSGKIFTFPTEKNHTYLIYQADQRPSPADLDPILFDRNKGQVNYYGVKRLPRF